MVADRRGRSTPAAEYVAATRTGNRCEDRRCLMLLAQSTVTPSNPALSNDQATVIVNANTLNRPGRSSACAAHWYPTAAQASRPSAICPLNAVSHALRPPAPFGVTLNATLPLRTKAAAAFVYAIARTSANRSP